MLSLTYNSKRFNEGFLAFEVLFHGTMECNHVALYFWLYIAVDIFTVC